jgi:6-phosphofructokinase 2
MPEILTVTLNPALDVSTSIDRIAPTHKMRCQPAQTHAGGGGINVARVVRRLGGDCLALFPAGGAHGELLHQLLQADQVPCAVTPIAQDTRESFSVLELSTGQQWRFVLPGPTLAEAEWQLCLDAIAAMAPAPRFLVASGSLPPGVPDDFYARLTRLALSRGSRMVLDTSGPALKAALNEGVYLFKPSLSELRGLTGLALTDEAQWRQAAQDIVQRGQAEVVALSLGDQGALLVTAQATWRAPSLPVPVVASTIGAGDSFLGALVWALNEGQAMEEAFCMAMAAGASALRAPGTALCDVDDVRQLRQQVQLTRL